MTSAICTGSKIDSVLYNDIALWSTNKKSSVKIVATYNIKLPTIQIVFKPGK